jgi:hypothetical protein
MKDRPYLEDELQKAFTPWFIETNGYRELYEDAMATGASFDSVGYIGATPVLIEFKNVIGSKEVRAAGDHHGILESKIIRGLQCLWGERQEMITEVLRTWDRRATPHLFLVANRVAANVRDELSAMLARRSCEWLFNYTVLSWRGTEAETVLTAAPIGPTLPSGVRPTIPAHMSPPAAPRWKRTSAELVELATTLGVRELFDAMIERARSCGASLERRTASCNFRFARIGEPGRSSVVGVWLRESSASEGLIVNYSPDDVRRCFRTDPSFEERLPGRPTERRGYLNRSRYLHSLEEVREFWRVITGEG